MKKIIKIVIKGATLPSWNHFNARMHWTEREEIVDEWKSLVGWECKRCKLKLFKRPVGISITCYFKNKNRMLDADNICSKLAIDGLKSIVILDDDPRYVTGVTTHSRLDRDNPRTEIMIGDIYDKME